MGWWDDFTTRAGDTLIAPYQPFGAMMPGMPAPTPEQRNAMIGGSLLTLGSALSQGARQRLPIGESLGAGWNAMQQQGSERAKAQLQMGLLGQKISEGQRAAQRRDALAKAMDDPNFQKELGPYASLFKYMPEDQQGALIAKLAAQRQERDENVSLFRQGAGALGSGDTGGGPPQPSGGVFDVPQQYAPQVSAAAAKHGVPPQLLASTFWNESRWQPNAWAPNDHGPGRGGGGLGGWGAHIAQAKGFNPLDPNASIENTAATMKEFAGKYGGNWMLARLAYGWGPGNVDNWLKAGGDPAKLPSGARVWLPRTAFGTAGEAESAAAFPHVVGMLKPGPVNPWEQRQGPVAGPQQPAGGPPAVTPVQYTPPGPQTAAAPQTGPRADARPTVPLQTAMPGIPPGVMRLAEITARKDPAAGLKILEQYIGPKAAGESVIYDSRSRQFIVNPLWLEAERQKSVATAPPQTITRDGKPVLVPGSEAFGQTPTSAANEQERLRLEQRAKQVSEANQNVSIGPDGRPIVNPTALQAKVEIARAGAPPAAEAEALKLNASDASKLASEIQAHGLKARSALANNKQLGALLEGIDTGRFKETTTDIKRIAKGVGIDLNQLGIKDDVPQAEAARALVGQMALQLRDPSAGAGMPGAMSDQDRNFLTGMTPGLETTPQGRKLMLQYQARVYEHGIALAKVASDYRRSPQWATDPQGIHTAMQQYAEANPIFRQEDIDAVTQARGSRPMPTNPAPEQPAYDPAAIDREIERRRKAGPR